MRASCKGCDVAYIHLISAVADTSCDASGGHVPFFFYFSLPLRVAGENPLSSQFGQLPLSGSNADSKERLAGVSEI